MKKTLAVLMAALLAAVCFATIGSAATISASLNEDYADVTATKDLSKLFDGVTYVEKNEITEGADAWKTDGSAYTQGDIVLFKNAKATDKTAGTKLVLNIDLGEAKDLDSVVVYFFKEYSSMIGLGVSNTMTISASTDGETYNKVGDFEFDSEPALQEDNKTTNGVLGVYPETFEFEETVNARYLELALPYEESADTFYVTPGDPESGVKGIWEFIGITEIAFSEASEGGDVSSDESKDESVNESAAESTEAPVTSSGTSSAADSSTPSTGDAGVIAVVVLAVAAVVGAAVIVKKRA